MVYLWRQVSFSDILSQLCETSIYAELAGPKFPLAQLHSEWRDEA